MSDVTQILHAIEQGDPHAASQLLPLVYDELRKLAAHRLAQQTPGQTLQPTALVHEAYLRLVGDPAGQDWDSRGHFFAAAVVLVQRVVGRGQGGLQRHGPGARGGADQPADDGGHVAVQGLADFQSHGVCSSGDKAGCPSRLSRAGRNRGIRR
jgi:hypothetical protein